MWKIRTHQLSLIVWAVLFPEEVRNRLVSDQNRQGDITNSDLELAGILLGWIVLEAIMPQIKHYQTGMFCDNTPTVAWENRLASKRSIKAGRLLQALALQQRLAQVPPLLTMSIAREKNYMVDLASRAFCYDEYKTLTESYPFFARHLNLHSPLPQKQHWSECHLKNDTSTSVIYEMLGRR